MREEYLDWSQSKTFLVCHIFTAVLSNTAEDALMHRLLHTNKHNLLSIPAAHHEGEALHVEIRLGLNKIIKMV